MSYKTIINEIQKLSENDFKQFAFEMAKNYKIKEMIFNFQMDLYEKLDHYVDYLSSIDYRLLKMLIENCLLLSIEEIIINKQRYIIAYNLQYEIIFRREKQKKQ